MGGICVYEGMIFMNVTRNFTNLQLCAVDNCVVAAGVHVSWLPLRFLSCGSTGLSQKPEVLIMQHLQSQGTQGVSCHECNKFVTQWCTSVDLCVLCVCVCVCLLKCV